MSELWTTEHRCPVCHGVGRTKHFNNVGLVDLSKGPDYVRSIKFPVILDPNYVAMGYPKTWSDKGQYLCAGCAGEGTLSAYTARVLSGEFVPHEANS